MKVIWDQQNEEPLYAFDRAALQAGLKRKFRGFKRLVLFFEIVMMGVTTGGVALYVVKIIQQGPALDRLLAGGILAAAAAHFLVGIQRRRRRESKFDQSLLGDLNKALWQVDHHIARSRALRWEYILPLVLAITIDFLWPFDAAKPFWPFLLFLLTMAVATWGIEWEIRCLYLPKKRRLEALRNKLATPES